MKETGRKINQQIVGNVGLYYCCYQLSLRGWNVMPTARNARGIDIVAYNDNGFVGIQVKSLSKKSPVPLGTDLSKISGDFWVIVNELESGQPKVFVLTPDEVRNMHHKGEKEDKVSYWLQPKHYMTSEFGDKWERIQARGPYAH